MSYARKSTRLLWGLRMSSSDDKKDLQGKKIRKWVNEVLLPFFCEYERKITADKSEELFRNIWVCFAKNSNVAFELLLSRDTSYQVAQTMRLLVELTADASFIVSHKENVNHLKSEANIIIKKYELENDKEKWREYIAEAGNICLEINDRPAHKNGYGTEKRVEAVFGDGFYTFYSCYSYMNIFTLRDDAKRLADDSFVSAQHWELIRDYPIILEKFIHIISEAINDGSLAKMDCSELTDGFNEIFENDNEVAHEQD